eukprot:5994299-Amphidinium_carterae.1
MLKSWIVLCGGTAGALIAGLVTSGCSNGNEPRLVTPPRRDHSATTDPCFLSGQTCACTFKLSAMVSRTHVAEQTGCRHACVRLGLCHQLPTVLYRNRTLPELWF